MVDCVPMETIGLDSVRQPRKRVLLLPYIVVEYILSIYCMTIRLFGGCRTASLVGLNPGGTEKWMIKIDLIIQVVHNYILKFYQTINFYIFINL